MLEHAPPGLDQRIRKRDLGAGQNTFEKPRVDELVDGSVEVLDATVGQQIGLPLATPFEAVSKISAVVPG